MRIALDAMGGDHAPGPIVAGAVQAVAADPAVTVVLVGDRLSRRFLKGVRRPGIVTAMPTARGPCAIIDVGANVHPRATHLYQYGVMGAIYAKHILGKENPTVGLMNIGEEEGKGHELAVEAYALLK